MNALLRHLLVYFSLIIASSLFAATISSKSTGGDWSLTSTWNGGVIPGASDDVVINGLVTLNTSSSCNNITINSSGTLINIYNYSRSLNVKGELINYGKVSSDATSSTMTLYLNGDFQNFGIYEPSRTYMNNGTSHEISLSTGTWLKGDWYFGANDILDFQSNIRFKDAYIDGVSGTSRTQFKTNNYRFDTESITINEIEVLSSGSVKLDSSLVEYFKLTGDATTEGYTSIGSSVIFNGNVTNTGTLYNRSNWSKTLTSYGKLINKGEIISDPTNSSFTIELYGDLDNQNIYYPDKTYVNGSIKIQGNEDKYLSGTWYMDGADSLTLTSDILFTNVSFDGVKNSTDTSTILTNGYTFNTLKTQLQYLLIKGSDTLNLDSSFIKYAVVEGDAVFVGYTTIGYNVLLNGEMTNEGTLVNENNWSRTLTSYGKLINKGEIISDSTNSTFSIELYAGLDNQNIYHPDKTYVNGNSLIQCNEDKHLSGTWYMDGADSLTLTSDLLFIDAGIEGVKSSTETSTILTNGYTLSAKKAILQKVVIKGADTLNLDSCLIKYMVVEGDAILVGYTSVSYDVAFVGNITNIGTLDNENNWSRTLESYGSLINNGEIRSDATNSTFTIDLYGDLDNQSTYNPDKTFVNGNNKIQCNKYEYLSGAWYLDGTDTITLVSDLLFVDVIIDGVKNSTDTSTILTNGYKFNSQKTEFKDLVIKGSDTLNLDSSYLGYTIIEGDAVSVGRTFLGYNVVLNGSITNMGMLSNENNSSRILSSYGKLINKGEIVSDLTNSTISIYLYGDIINSGVYNPDYTYLKNKSDHTFIQSDTSPFRGKYFSLDTLDALVLGSDVTFSDAALDGQNTWPYSSIKTNGFTLTLDGGSLIEWRIDGEDTIKFNNTNVGNTHFVDDALINGIIRLSSGNIFQKKLTNYGVMQNINSFSRSFTVQEELINEGVISSSGGPLTVYAYGSIVNNSNYDPTSTYLKGKSSRTIYSAVSGLINGKFYVKDTFTLLGESFLPHLEVSYNGLLTVDSNASLSVKDYYSGNDNNQIVNLNRINVKKPVDYYLDYYYRAKAYFHNYTDMGNIEVETYSNQQHPSTEGAIPMWWRFKPDSTEKLKVFDKLELTYNPKYLSGLDEDSIRVFFSPNAGLSWEEIKEGKFIDTSNNRITLDEAETYGHYVISSTGLGVISFEPLVQRAEPKAVGNKGQVTVYGFGIWLNDSMNVYLKKAGSNNIVADTVYLTDAYGESFIATFNVDLAAIGKYSMVLELAGQDDLELTDYFTIEAAERPEPWVMLGGRDKYLTNRWQTFTINYGNRANMDARGVPLFFMINHVEGMEVVFPDFDIGVQKSFIDDGWTQWQDTIIELYYTSDSFAGYEGKMMRLYPFYVPSIGAMSSESVRVKVKVPTQANLEMEVWVTDAMYEGIPSKQKAGVPPEVASCINSAGAKYLWDKAIGFIPGYDCYKLGYKVLETGVGEVMKDPNEPPKESTWFSYVNTAWGWTWSVLECAGDIIPVGKSIKIGKELLDIVFDTKSNFDATQDCWDKFKKKGKGKHKSKGVNSFDPNEITGPTGYGTEGYIEANANMVYTVYFENKDSATAAANQVIVYDTLDKTKFDFSTFSFGDITIGDSTYEIQSFAKEFRIILDLAPRIETLVQVTGSLDTASGEIKVNYQSVDRSTLEEQEDVDLGFLPPNKNRPEGEGNFSYNVALKSTLAHDAYIENKALIFFDGNKPIATNVHSNRIDKQAPSSSVIALPAETTDSNFVVSWSGSDPGCGIQNYTVMVSVNDSDFVVWKSNTSLTSDTYFGRNKTRYAFYSIATDSLGLTEGINDEADASTYVKVNTGSIDDLMKQQIVIGTNAASDLLTIKLNEPGEATIYDISGRLLMQSTLNAGINNLNISHLIPQTYVVVVNTKSTEVRRKIVVLPN